MDPTSAWESPNACAARASAFASTAAGWAVRWVVLWGVDRTEPSFQVKDIGNIFQLQAGDQGRTPSSPYSSAERYTTPSLMVSTGLRRSEMPAAGPPSINPH